MIYLRKSAVTVSGDQVDRPVEHTSLDKIQVMGDTSGDSDMDQHELKELNTINTWGATLSKEAGAEMSATATTAMARLNRT